MFFSFILPVLKFGKYAANIDIFHRHLLLFLAELLVCRLHINFYSIDRQKNPVGTFRKV